MVIGCCLTLKDRYMRFNIVVSFCELGWVHSVCLNAVVTLFSCRCHFSLQFWTQSVLTCLHPYPPCSFHRELCCQLCSVQGLPRNCRATVTLSKLRLKDKGKIFGIFFFVRHECSYRFLDRWVDTALVCFLLLRGKTNLKQGREESLFLLQFAVVHGGKSGQELRPRPGGRNCSRDCGGGELTDSSASVHLAFW